MNEFYIISVRFNSAEDRELYRWFLKKVHRESLKRKKVGERLKFDVSKKIRELIKDYRNSRRCKK